jgi:pyruvate,water dikinase
MTAETITREATMTDYILPLTDPRTTLATAGGKAASLARLAAAGLPVPAGFTVTTAAYRAFVAANDLQPAILAALADVDARRPATLDEASRRIHERFAAARVPAEIAAAITAAYATLAGDEPAVAVRSSATAEDLPEASFAGQQETFLNVAGAAALVSAVQRCWASLWTARAIGYRAQRGIDPDAVALAVVVQLLVPADASGILFTADPVGGHRDQAIISAAWGLGEAIVGGRVTPDTLTVDKASGRVLAREIADKQIMTVRVDGGTAERPVPEPLRRAPALSDAVAAELTRYGVEIESLYGAPMDVEWVLAGGKIALVQARPITALAAGPAPEAEPEAGAPVEWRRPMPKALYARASMAEHLANPVRPLFATLALRLANVATKALFDRMAGRKVDAIYGYTTINDYVYMGMQVTLREAGLFLKIGISQTPVMLRAGLRPWEEARVRLAEVVRRWEAQDPAALPPAELLRGAREVFAEVARYYTVVQSSALPMASTSELLFSGFYRLFIKRRGDPDATVFLFGFDSAAQRTEKSLFDLATWAREQPALREHLLASPAAQLARELAEATPPAGVPAESWAELRARFQTHLASGAHSAYDFDFSSPVPAETPDALLEALKLYLAGRGSDPYARQAAAAERREEATRRVLARTRWPLRGWFERLLRWAQTVGPAREDAIAEMGLGHPVIRRLLGELGRRLAAAGALPAAGDIYWLLEDEVSKLAAALESGEALPDVSARIPPRQAEWRAALRLNPPAMLPERSRWAAVMPWSHQQKDRTVLKGLAASAGQVTAPAAVLYGPEDFGRMRPGDVLVAVTTTPAWTPLFALASAVVTDIGGPLSHSSIVAREYGIPAVMATGVATRRIRSGQIITVDGTAGIVRLPPEANA